MSRALRTWLHRGLMLLVALALVLSSPLAAFAREDRVNGRDGAEGDPGDGLGAIGGGGGSGDILGGDSDRTARAPIVIGYPIAWVFASPELGTIAILIPTEWLDDSEAFECR